ncbi:MAG: diaminopimelate decarboxylase, partial [Nitrospinae bacterium]|nr:diaminopimelate decarboxylase [Nitrospinota bacterium]
MTKAIETLSFLTEKQVREIAIKFGTPLFVYSKRIIEEKCAEALAFPNPYGLTVRYAMKANPNKSILKLINNTGIHIDASSEFEVKRAITAGIEPEKILLTSQQIPRNFKDVIKDGVMYNACSLHQLIEYGKIFPGSNVSVRFNPGKGSGGTKKTDVGGPTSSFGIWLEYINEVKEITEKYNLTVERIHSHIGSGSDPDVWEAVSEYTIEIVEQFPDVTHMNLGGGFKVGRMMDETSTNLQKIGQPVKKRLEDFYNKTGRKIHLEIEPGTYLAALSGVILMEVIDKVDTGSKGYNFIKVNSGMDSNTRPSLYNAKHPIIT